MPVAHRLDNSPRNHFEAERSNPAEAAQSVAATVPICDPPRIEFVANIGCPSSAEGSKPWTPKLHGFFDGSAHRLAGCTADAYACAGSLQELAQPARTRCDDGSGGRDRIDGHATLGLERCVRQEDGVCAQEQRLHPRVRHERGFHANPIGRLRDQCFAVAPVATLRAIRLTRDRQLDPDATHAQVLDRADR